MPKLDEGFARYIEEHKPDKKPNLTVAEWNKFIVELKKEYSPQQVKQWIADEVGGSKDKKLVMEKLKVMMQSDVAKERRKQRKKENLAKEKR